MAKISVPQDSGTITVTTAGETRKDYRVTGGVITTNKTEAAHLLQVVPGATLVEGTLDDADVAVDETADVTEPPALPTPAEKAAADAKTRR